MGSKPNRFLQLKELSANVGNVDLVRALLVDFCDFCATSARCIIEFLFLKIEIL